jgi:hypothetical protein
MRLVGHARRLLLFARLKPGADFSPSPGTPGEGRGEGDFERRTPVVLEISLILTFSRSTGRRDRKKIRTLAARTGVNWETAHRAPSR